MEKVYISNAFSLSQVKNILPCELRVKELVPSDVKEVIKDGYTSIFGHPDVARLASTSAGIDFPVNRTEVFLEKGDKVVVFQYHGPRLPEGTTELPEGASLKWMLLEVIS